MKKFIKILLLIVLIIFVGTIAVIGYAEYDEYSTKQKQLSYATNHKWKWHDEYDRIQIRYVSSSGRSVLRKVNMRDKYVIYVFKDGNYNLNAIAEFIVDCDPGKEIVTTKKYSDGTPKKLICSKDGSSLRYFVKWDRDDTNFTWVEELGGFSVYENFMYWDFAKLDREVTLSKDD